MDALNIVTQNLTSVTALLNEHRDLLYEASELLSNAYQEIKYGGDAAGSLDLYKVEQWQERKQTLLMKTI